MCRNQKYANPVVFQSTDYTLPSMNAIKPDNMFFVLHAGKNYNSM